MKPLLTENLKKTVKQARLEKTALPLCEEIKLYLLSQDYPKGPLPDEDMLTIINSPAYWAFCWASGQVLARWIMDNPELFSGKTVLDFGAGSGIAGIAAAKSGATKVIACDIDSDALDACRENACLNEVNLEILHDFQYLNESVDIILAADVLYDRENLPMVQLFLEKASEVLIADSRLKIMEPPGYKLLLKKTATTVPDLDEHREFSNVRIYYYANSALSSQTL